jgi:hypothetical protein
LITKSSGFFFNTREFVMRNPDQKTISFPENAPTPHIYFTWAGNELVSLARSTFGGFIDSDNASTISTTISEILKWTNANEIRSVVIRCFPDIYSAGENKLTRDALLQAGFEIASHDITQFLDVTENELTMNVHRKRRLRKCSEQGFTFKILHTDSLADAYQLFLDSRENKQYPVTMSIQDFENAFDMFPDRYILFGVVDQGKIIAACVAVAIDTEILYSFFVGDSLAYRVYSPVTQLLDGVYRYAQNKKMKIVDLGISTDKGIVNEGLYAFKKSLGARDSAKLTYQIKL